MSKNASNKKSIDPTVLAAIITVVGGLITTLIINIVNRPEPPQPTPVPPTAVAYTATLPPTAIPTDTVPAGDPTSTPAPATDTPAPTHTATEIPPLALGTDWGQGCISSLWQPYSSKGPIESIGKDGCLSQPVTVFFANNGRLSFLYESRLSSAEVIGMFAPLPVSEGSVSLYVSLNDLNTSDIWVGVFSGQSIDAQGLLMTIPAGSVSSRPFVAWQMPGQNKITTTQFTNQGAGYGLKFEFNAGSVRAVVLPNVFATNTYPVPSNQKWLFIGFQAKNGTNRIDASFSDLVISP